MKQKTALICVKVEHEHDCQHKSSWIGFKRDASSIEKEVAISLKTDRAILVFKNEKQFKAMLPNETLLMSKSKKV